MLTSTLLTLVVIPVVYSLLDDLSCGVLRILGVTVQQDIEARPIHLADQDVEQREKNEPQVAAALKTRETAKAS